VSSAPDPPLERARAAAQAMSDRDGASRSLGITVGDVSPGRAVAQTSVAPSLVDGHGIARSGHVLLLAHTALALDGAQSPR
jgi:acyl-CoA thioesterase